MLVVIDLEEALKKASYKTLLDMFESVLVAYYLTDEPAEREEVGKAVIAVAAEASLRGVPTCPADLDGRDAAVRTAMIRTALARRPVVQGDC